MPVRRIAINLTSIDGTVDVALVDMVTDPEEGALLLTDLWCRADIAERRLRGESIDTHTKLEGQDPI